MNKISEITKEAFNALKSSDDICLDVVENEMYRKTFWKTKYGVTLIEYSGYLVPTEYYIVDINA
jgi:hypothetical protein